jgi:pyruvate ferredoxin oxidoreductase alpha subunit
MQALGLIPEFAAEFRQIFGRDSGGLVRAYRCDDAETIVVALGSVLGTIKDVVDECASAAADRRAWRSNRSGPPFPLVEVRERCNARSAVVVLEKTLAVRHRRRHVDERQGWRPITSR